MDGWEVVFAALVLGLALGRTFGRIAPLVIPINVPRMEEEIPDVEISPDQP